MLIDFTYALHEVVARMDHRADTVLRAELGISFNLFQFLAIVSDEEPTDVTGLASCLYISKAAVSKRLPALADEGWLTVDPDPTHGRKLKIQLTDKGRDVIAAGHKVLERTLASLLGDGVDAQELARFRDLLLTLNARLLETEEPWL